MTKSRCCRERRARQRQRTPQARDGTGSKGLDCPSTVATWSLPHAPSLANLPDVVAATLASFLDTHALRAVVWSIRDVPPPLAEALQQRVQLRIPPGSIRNRLIVSLIQAHYAAALDVVRLSSQKKSPPLLLTHFAIADIQVAANLMRIANRVRGLALSSDQYTAWPARPFRWSLLQKFTALERLEIDHVWDQPLDVEVISYCTPQLRTLLIKRARHVVNGLVGLTNLCVLHLEDTNIESFAFAVGLPSLQSLTLLTSPYRYRIMRQVACLAEIAPLTRLVVRGVWEHCPRVVMKRHADTLRAFAQLDGTWMDFNAHPAFPTQWMLRPAWSTLVHLRSLRMGRFPQTDTSPLTVLVALEELQIGVGKAAGHCRPLRHLTRLRELHITNGWVCDLVGYLPRLETLVWEVYPDGFRYMRNTLCRREWPDCQDGNDEASVRRNANGEGVGVTTRLRKLVLRGELSIDTMGFPSVQTMVEHVEHLEVHKNTHRVDAILREIEQLRHLKRLIFWNTFLPTVRHVSERRWLFASVESLEELYYTPLTCSEYNAMQTAPLPESTVTYPTSACLRVRFKSQLSNSLAFAHG